MTLLELAGVTVGDGLKSDLMRVWGQAGSMHGHVSFCMGVLFLRVSDLGFSPYFFAQSPSAMWLVPILLKCVLIYPNPAPKPCVC